MMPDKPQNLQIAFVKGALLGPLAIIPAAYLLFIISSAPFSMLSEFTRGLNSTLFIALWGLFVAYVMTLTYGTILWLLLLKLKKLNLIWLLAGSLLPSFLLLIYSQSIGFTVICAYFSLAVSFGCWYFSVRKRS